MTREEIVKKLQAVRTLLPDLEDRETIDEAIYVINHIEAIEQRLNAKDTKDNWIPVEEALPLNMNNVLVTVVDTEGEHYTSTDRYDVIDGKWLFDDNRNVVAWQPFPEAYKAFDEAE